MLLAQLNKRATTAITSLQLWLSFLARIERCCFGVSATKRNKFAGHQGRTVDYSDFSATSRRAACGRPLSRCLPLCAATRNAKANLLTVVPVVPGAQGS